jgi:hypothetical protein
MPNAPSVADLNGGGPQTLGWEPETPFLNAPPVPRVAATNANGGSFARGSTIESPFTAEYAGEDAHGGAHAEAFASLMDELRDEEFAEALEDLVNDAGAVLEDGFSGEIGDPVRERFTMERTIRDYLEPLAMSSEAMLERMAAGLGERDLGALPETELDRLLEEFAPAGGDLSPAFEGFLGGVFKKAKRAVKGALKVAKKVAGAVAFPHMLVLNRLKGLVRPLLERVLRFAIDKLPVALRPAASQLAQRFLGIKVAATAAQPKPGAPDTAAEPAADAAAADPASLEEEVDTRIAGYLLGAEEFEREEEAELLASAQAAPATDPMYWLERSRRDFAEGVVRYEGEDPRPLVEQFVPAILAALRIGIKVVGRPRVVKFLAGLVAKLIQKYVGAQQAPALSSALVDAGLRVVSLEAADEATAPAGDALAATVEDTVNRLVQTAPAAAWDNETLLETYVHEAFQQAAAAHFPDPLIRNELHETADANGAWVPLPANTPRKRYKKYSRVIDVSISPQIAATLKTFAGVPLRNALKDRLGVTVDRPIQARAHLYEAIPGTRLSAVALHERGVPGLGSARRHAWSLFHPLTPEAAGLLLKEPGLGRAVEAPFLIRRRVTAVGQRFYFLEIPGARVRLAPRMAGKPSRPARSTQTRITIDFVKRQLRLALYYSEADAQEISKQLRQKAPLPVLLRALRGRHDAALTQILSGEPTSALRLVHEEAPTEELATPLLAPVLRMVGGKLSGVVLTWLLEALHRELQTRYDRFTGEFERAAQADEDGVSVVVTFEAPPLLEQLRRLLKPGGIVAAPAALAALARQTVGSYQVDFRAGFARG